MNWKCDEPDIRWIVIRWIFNSTLFLEIFLWLIDLFSFRNEIEVLPFNGWLTEAIINISKESINLTRIFTHPLLRREIKHTLVKSQCDTSASTVEIFLRETVLTPRSHLKYEIKAFPESLIVPASGSFELSRCALNNAYPPRASVMIFYSKLCPNTVNFCNVWCSGRPAVCASLSVASFYLQSFKANRGLKFLIQTPHINMPSQAPARTLACLPGLT